MNKYIILAMSALVLSGCKCRQKEVSPVAEAMPQATVQPAMFMPKATAFRMSGDYADNVAVTLNAAGNLSYYPAPTDITENTRPVEIGDGWWLNRQGLGANSVFTRYTFDEYRALKQAPSPQEIKDAIIPGAVVTDFRQLPLSLSESLNVRPSSLLEYLR